MKFVKFILFLTLFLFVNCNEKVAENKNSKIIAKSNNIKILEKNKEVVRIVKEYGPNISSSYEKAVCTELVIQVIEKMSSLNERDKKRIRIITDENIQDLLKSESNIPKGVYYALKEKGIGVPIQNQNDVCEGDFVQFWTETWGHCGIVKSINPEKKEMELYSSFPSTNGYGIQKFNLPKYAFFVRLQRKNFR